MSKSSKKQLSKQAPIANQNNFGDQVPLQNNMGGQELQSMPNPSQSQGRGQPMPPQGKDDGLVKTLVGNFLKGGTEDQPGLLDNDPEMGGGHGNQNYHGRESQSKIRGNQDLWLLNLFFKSCAILVFFFLYIVFPKALTNIVVLMLVSIDFWIVKNIVGRKLIKMRWWFIIDNEGNQRWHYESRQVTILFQDKLVFWGTLYISPLLWGLLCVKNAITLDILDTATTVVCALVSLVQLYGFRSCANAHERKQKIMARRRGMRGGPQGQRKGNRNDPMQQNLIDKGQQNKKYKK